MTGMERVRRMIQKWVYDSNIVFVYVASPILSMNGVKFVSKFSFLNALFEAKCVVRRRRNRCERKKNKAKKVNIKTTTKSVVKAKNQEQYERNFH